MLTLNITQEDIDNSQPMLEEKNPLGFALRKIFPTSKIHVGINFVHIDGRRFELSPELNTYLENYDIFGQAIPITCELDLVF